MCYLSRPLKWTNPETDAAPEQVMFREWVAMTTNIPWKLPPFLEPKIEVIRLLTLKHTWVCHITCFLEYPPDLTILQTDSDGQEFEDDPLLQVLRQQRKWLKEQLWEVDEMLQQLWRTCSIYQWCSMFHIIMFIFATIYAILCCGFKHVWIYF